MLAGNENRFGDYVFQGSPRVLVRGQKVVDLPHRQLKVLSVLLAAKGGVVSRDTLMDAVWRDVCVEEHNLTQTIFLLRRSLGRLPDGQDYIETVPRKGYRISSAALTTTAKGSSVPPPSHRRAAERWRWALRSAAPWLSHVLRLPRLRRSVKQASGGSSSVPEEGHSISWQMDRRGASAPAKERLRWSRPGWQR